MEIRFKLNKVESMLWNVIDKCPASERGLQGLLDSAKSSDGRAREILNTRVARAARKPPARSQQMTIAKFWLVAFVLGLPAVAPAKTWSNITTYPLPLANNPFAITMGPDGALWFTEEGGKIGRITTSGAITEYHVPTAGSSPAGITAGPDGALWFTEENGNKIGRITTAGVISEWT